MERIPRRFTEKTAHQASQRTIHEGSIAFSDRKFLILAFRSQLGDQILARSGETERGRKDSMVKQDGMQYFQFAMSMLIIYGFYAFASELLVVDFQNRNWLTCHSDVVM